LANTSSTFIRSSPRFTGPVSGAEFIFRRVTVVTGPEVFAPARLVFFDRHFAVAKPDELNFIAFFGEDGAFFAFPRRPFWFVVSGKGFTSILYPSRR
jgi:hypothetical protein